MHIGFIGLGIMGKPMASNLIKAGHHLKAYDLAPDRIAEAAGFGATPAKSAKDAAAGSEVTITMVPDGPEIEVAVLGTAGALEGAQPGGTIIDMSSISPIVAQKVAVACSANGVEFLDAPVSGGEPKAIDGSLAIMVGGKQETFDKVLPLFLAMGSSATLTGPVEAGNAGT